MRVRLAILFGIPLLTLIVLVFYWRGQMGGPGIEPGSTLVVDLSGAYVEGAAPPLLARVFGSVPEPFIGTLSTFAKARRDDRIERVVVRIGALGVGWAKAQELHDAIRAVRDSGRHTIAYLELAALGANREFYVAAAADEIHLVPGATVPMVGLVAQYLFLSELADKLGIGFDVTRAGKYKSATEIFTEEELSPESLEMAESLLDATEAQFVRGIAEGRGLDPAAVRAAIDSGPVLPAQLEGLGLIDGVRHLNDLLGDSPVVWDWQYRAVDPAKLGFDPAARFALVYGVGNMVMSGGATPGGDAVFAADAAREALQQAAEDESIDAIVLRIDSPGGSSLAAEVIWDATRRASESKPVVASLSDYAASGGYYVASAADAIVSQPGTLTGSIGVFSVRTVDRGLRDKLGVGFQTLTRGRHADLLLPFESPSPASNAKMQDVVVAIYDLFLERVAEGRAMDPADVDAIGQGRVWTGEQARRHGLVDELGGLRVAVDRALRELGQPEGSDVALVPYPAPRTLVQQLSRLLDARIATMRSSLSQADFARARAMPGLGAPFVTLERFLRTWPGDGPMAWLPLGIDIR